MELNDFQQKVSNFAVYPGSNQAGVNGLVYCTLGLTGESGEVAEKVKKLLRDQNGILNEDTRIAIGYELSDVLWYIQQTARELNYTLEDIAVMNINKLSSRAKRGVLGGNGDDR